MANAEQLSILKEGVEAWNSWRERNAGAEIDLRGAELRAADLNGANLSHAGLEGANLAQAQLVKANLMFARLREASLSYASLDGANLAHADMTKANLTFASLRKAVLPFARLEGADLRAADLKKALAEDSNFRGANLSHANLQKAILSFSYFRGANMSDANLAGANLVAARLQDVNVASIKFDQQILWKVVRDTGWNLSGLWGRRYDILLDTTMRVKGINAASCYGSQRFTVFLKDQDFLEEYKETPSGRRWLAVWWLFADCGRSLARWAGWSFCFITLFAFIYMMFGRERFQLEYLDFCFTSFLYYSMVTFSTLGTGDILPKTTATALLTSVEVVVGYLMLGGLISIFAVKLARRG